MKLIDFCEKYDITPNNFHVAIHQGTVSRNSFVKDKKAIYVIEDYFLKRNKYRVDIINKAHDNYYFLSQFFKDSEIAKKIVEFNVEGSLFTWNTFIRNGLFSIVIDKNILNTKIAPKLWEFYRVTNWIISRIFRDYAVPKDERNIEYYLDDFCTSEEKDIEKYFNFQFDKIEHYYDYHEAKKLLRMSA